MVANHSSSSPSTWRHTNRTLGALFTGSAVMLSATLVHGNSLVLSGTETESIAEPLVSEPVQANQTDQTKPETAISGPGQAARWTPGAAPQWGSSLKDLPVRRAPVQAAMRQGPFASAAPVATAADPAGPPTPAADPPAPGSTATEHTAPGHEAGDTGTGAAESGAGGTQAANPAPNESSDGLLGGVLDVPQGLPK